MLKSVDTRAKALRANMLTAKRADSLETINETLKANDMAVAWRLCRHRASPFWGHGTDGCHASKRVARQSMNGASP